MPYEISRKNGQYFVENSVTRRILGHHKTKKEAIAQVVAVKEKEHSVRQELSQGVKVHMSGTFPAPKTYDQADGIS